MAITTTVQPRQTWRNSIAAVVCAGLGLWGLYDWAVKIPARDALVAEHRALTAEKDALEAKRARGETLTREDIDRYETIVVELATRFREAPVPPAPFDRAVQLWVYVIGCGVLGTPFFIWPLIALPRKRWTLEDDGTLHCPEGSSPIAELKGIDMSRWMEKSIATVTLPNGTRSVLDDYKYRNIDRIVGAIASHFYPEEWTADARPVDQETTETATAKE